MKLTAAGGVFTLLSPSSVFSFQDDEEMTEILEFCIENGLAVFNPGTQGEHKIQRGFEPVYCYSNHWLKEPAFHHAISNFIKDEYEHIDTYKKQAEELLPFKSTE